MPPFEGAYRVEPWFDGGLNLSEKKRGCRKVNAQRWVTDAGSKGGVSPWQGRGQSPSRVRDRVSLGAQQRNKRETTDGLPFSLSRTNRSRAASAHKPADTGNRERAARTFFRSGAVDAGAVNALPPDNPAVLFEHTAPPATPTVRKSLVRGAHELSCKCGQVGGFAARGDTSLIKSEGDRIWSPFCCFAARREVGAALRARLCRISSSNELGRNCAAAPVSSELCRGRNPPRQGARAPLDLAIWALCLDYSYSQRCFFRKDRDRCL